MVIIVNRVGEKIVISINAETLQCNYEEKLFNTLQKLINQDFPNVTTMEEAKTIEAEVRQLVEGQGNEATENFVETACKDHLFYNEAKGTYHLKADNGKIVSSVPIPQSLVDRILVSVEKGIDPLPLIKATIRFFRNPNLSKKKLKNFVKYLNYSLTDIDLYLKLTLEGYSEDKAREMASYLQTPITLEGLLCTYKVSREVTTKWALDENGNKIQVSRYGQSINEFSGEITDEMPEFVEDRVFEPAIVGRNYDAFYCESMIPGDNFKVLDHIYKVGHVQYLENWNQVNCVDGTFGGGGLHLGNLNYIKGYNSPGTVVHNCFVDPMHIGGFTDEGEGAMRVKQLFIHSSKAGDNRGIYFSSKYAAHVDAEWEEMKKEAIENAAKCLEDMKGMSKKELELFENL